jgi:hypothetical protein
MGVGGKIASGIIKGVLVNPLLKQLEKETKEQNKLYNNFLNQIDQNIELENAERAKGHKVIEVHQQFDPIIHHHDFW